MAQNTPTSKTNTSLGDENTKTSIVGPFQRLWNKLAMWTLKEDDIHMITSPAHTDTQSVIEKYQQEQKNILEWEVLARIATYNNILNKQKQWRDTNQNQEQIILLDKTNEDIIHTIQWNTDIVCVDIDGTLIQQGRLNIRLVEMMHQYIQDGKYIFVFTNGNLDRNTEKLMMAGLDDIFLPAISKGNIQEREVAVIIDDVPPEKENLNCRQYIDPHSFI